MSDDLLDNPFLVNYIYLHLHDFVLDGIYNKAGGILAATLFENIGAVFVDGAFRDVESVGNLLGGEASADGDKNLLLTLREAVGLGNLVLYGATDTFGCATHRFGD